MCSKQRNILRTVHRSSAADLGEGGFLKRKDCANEKVHYVGGRGERGGCRSRTPDASDTLRAEMHRCIDTGLYSGLAVDPERDFAGVVLGGQIAGKEKTMDARVRLLQLMV